MVVLDATVVNVALPTIQRSLGFSEPGRPARWRQPGASAWRRLAALMSFIRDGNGRDPHAV
jgi:hypothetical protein